MCIYNLKHSPQNVFQKIADAEVFVINVVYTIPLDPAQHGAMRVSDSLLEFVVKEKMFLNFLFIDSEKNCKG